MKNLSANLVIAFGLLTNIPSAAYAAGFCPCPNEIPFEECCYDEEYGLGLSFYTGLIYGKSKEVVFAGADSTTPRQVVSILDWDIRNLWVLGGTIEKSFLCDSFHVTVDGWGKVNSGGLTMVDRDFLDPDAPGVLTDISKSPNSHLTRAYLVDAEICYDLFSYPMCDSLFTLGFLLGYQFSEFDWEAFGGNFSYASGTDIGSFPDGELVIAYRQQFSVPYLGFNVDWQIEDLEVSVFGKYTCLAYVEDHDFHALRDANFRDKFNAQQYWIAGAKASWNFLGNAWLEFKYDFERLEPAIGDTIQTEGGETTRSRRSAGVSHYHNLFSFGLNARF